MNKSRGILSLFLFVSLAQAAAPPAAEKDPLFEDLPDDPGDNVTKVPSTAKKAAPAAQPAPAKKTVTPPPAEKKAAPAAPETPPNATPPEEPPSATRANEAPAAAKKSEPANSVSAPAAKKAAEPAAEAEPISPKAIDPTGKATADATATTGPFDDLSDDALLEPDPPSAAPAPAAPATKAPAPDSPAASEITPEENDLPADVKALEKKVQDSGALSPNLVDGNDPGSALRPSDKFYRVPLKPRMSDRNWRRWAGPALEKDYRIRKGDTLWGVSDRLFGNPFLWPKVWQLNAQFGNPNVIAPGIELMFMPGNPNSAPELAFKNYTGLSTEDLPVMFNAHKDSMLDRIDAALRAQAEGERPPFQYFLLDARPAQAGKIELLAGEEHVFLTEGQNFKTDSADGEYSIVRVTSELKGLKRMFRLRWMGVAKVAQEKGHVTQSFAEIEKGDYLTTRKFALSALAIHEEKVGKEKAELMGLEEGAQVVSSENRLIGVRFGSLERGPRPGALITINRANVKIGTLLLIDRDERMGTFWAVDGNREFSIADDKLE